MSSKYAVPFLREYMYFVLCILFLTFTFLGILNNGEVCFLCFIVFQLQSQKKKQHSNLFKISSKILFCVFLFTRSVFIFILHRKYHAPTNYFLAYRFKCTRFKKLSFNRKVGNIQTTASVKTERILL